MNNQPAFPVSLPHLPVDSRAGMTLKDYFAASMLNGMAADPTLSGPDGPSCEQVAVLCYEMADAMLKAREDT